MPDITVTSITRETEKRDWLLEAQHHVQRTGTLDYSGLDLTEHAPARVRTIRYGAQAFRGSLDPG